jgi:hypothetical protein
VPGIHAFFEENKTWMAGASPAMTILTKGPEQAAPDLPADP